ncbi:hypothetical protein FACS1894168_3980 [Deltaproteobacteria bacterium]|nr:hypothetical protein FACS1894168_3980 [Deltaproteobacteria bacterium]
MGKLKQAYELNAHDVDELLSALLPDGVFTEFLWRKAYKSFWFGPLDSYLSAYRFDILAPQSRLKFLLFPEINTQHGVNSYIHQWKGQIISLFMSLCGILTADILKEGIDHIFEESYDVSSDIFKQERDKLFTDIALEDRNYAVKFAACTDINQLLENMDWKRHAIPHKDFGFLSPIFPETIVVDKAAAIRHLSKCAYSLRHEVKGISQTLVERIAATPSAPDQDSPAEPLSKPAGEVIRIPADLWQGKSSAAIRTDMRKGYADSVIAFVLYEWHGLHNKTHIGRLLGPKDTEQDDSSCRRRATRLLEEAASFTILQA